MGVLEEKAAAMLASLGLAPQEAGRVGVGLSGGADSVALLAVLTALGYECTALHCDFGLRGDESRRDHCHARDVAQQLGCSFKDVHFDVEAHRAQSGSLSLETACRELRFDWFCRLLEEGHVDLVALGHHREDNVETLLLNTARGAGLRGMAAIKPRRDFYIRPLLDCTKAEIVEYLSQRGLRYVTDSSNLQADCRRNILRLKIIPAIEEALPGFALGASRCAENLRGDYALLRELVKEKALRWTDTDTGAISLQEMNLQPRRDLLLYHILEDTQALNLSQVSDIWRSYDRGESGKRYGEKWLLDRGSLVPLAAERRAPHITLEKRLITPEEFEREKCDPRGGKSLLWLDNDKLQASAARLSIRKPAPGDRLQPFGMKGSRLVSDILTEDRVPLLQKKSAMLLVASIPGGGHERILWVVGHRTSRHFAVTNTTRCILRIEAVAH